MSKNYTFTRQTINVAIDPRHQSPEQPVQALVLGDLAVHGVLNADGRVMPNPGYYVVTHIPTGYKMASGYKQRNCKALVKELHALNLNWQFTSEERLLPDEIREKALPIIRAFISNTAN